MKNVFYSTHEISYFHSSFFILHSERSDYSSFLIPHFSFLILFMNIYVELLLFDGRCS